MICKKYSAQFKIMMVEEFLRKKQEQPKLSIAEFALNNGISDSTFNDWVVKYKRQGKGFCNITEEIKKLEIIEVIDSAPIQNNIIKEISDDNEPISINRVRMKYNGAIIEFDKSLLESALKILRTW